MHKAAASVNRNGTARTGKTHTIAALSYAFQKEELVRCVFTARVAWQNLGKIECRLNKETKGNANPIGGVSVIIVGDPGQLPPFAAPALYARSNHPYAKEGFTAYKSFSQVIKLTLKS